MPPLMGQIDLTPIVGFLVMQYIVPSSSWNRFISIDNFSDGWGESSSSRRGHAGGALRGPTPRPPRPLPEVVFGVGLARARENEEAGAAFFVLLYFKLNIVVISNNTVVIQKARRACVRGVLASAPAPTRHRLRSLAPLRPRSLT